MLQKSDKWMPHKGGVAPNFVEMRRPGFCLHWLQWRGAVEDH